MERDDSKVRLFQNSLPLVGGSWADARVSQRGVGRKSRTGKVLKAAHRVSLEKTVSVGAVPIKKRL
jgi:hypothetical protein